MATWTKEAIHILIDAYKNEPCLYQTRSPNYHNNNLRHDALKRICAIVNTIRPNTTEKECSTKFYNLRSQFNSENAKVRASIKSGIGSENVYRPNLWYYDALKFVEEHIIPRKISYLPNTKKNTPIHLLQHDYSQEQSEESQESILNTNETVFEDSSIYIHEEEDLNNNNKESQLYMSSSSDNIITATQPISEEINLHSRSLSFTNLSNINTSSPSRPCSALSSEQSSSNVYDMSQSPSIVRNSKKRKLKNEDVYVGTIESIVQSLKTPSTPVNIMTGSTDVGTCMSFLGSLLKNIKSRDIQLDVMNTLVQTIINANVTDLERAKR